MNKSKSKTSKTKKDPKSKMAQTSDEIVKNLVEIRLNELVMSNSEYMDLSTNKANKKRKATDKASEAKPKKSKANKSADPISIVKTNGALSKVNKSTDEKAVKKKPRKSITFNINIKPKAKKKQGEKKKNTSVLGELNEVFNKDLNQSTPIVTKKKKTSHIKEMPHPLNNTPVKTVDRIKIEPKTPTASNFRLSALDDDDSVAVGEHEFEFVIHPISIESFISENWEKKPLLVKRNNGAYYKKLISREVIDEMLRNNNVEYTKNIDITSYKNNVRKTHNEEGRILPSDMWSFYADGCSIRILNPQTFIHSVYEMNVKLQEYFNCMVGANVYLTPPNSQGFAPHYDDIEAFVLQVEGKKHWKLYAPRVAEEHLPRVSSGNFTQDEIGTPILDVVLEAGDLLYFPRGIIHQASTVPGHHSLHITTSVYQKNCYADLMELFLPIALASVTQEHIEFRQGVPMNLSRNLGIAHCDSDSADRVVIVNKMKDLFHRIFHVSSLDNAVDQLCKKFQHDALPPLLTREERNKTVFRDGYVFHHDGQVTPISTINLKTSVKLLRLNILRLVAEEDVIKIFYNVDNSREYHEYEPNFLEVDEDAALAVEALIKAYPRYVHVANLPVASPVEFANSLWEKGLLIFE